jgi:4-hydroxy-tetrahydrodipicolinate reductase
MRIALIGYGKMGKEVQKIALERGHTIAAIIDPKEKEKEISEHSIGSADLCIDFTEPGAVLGNIQKLAALKKNVVIGTTGWEEALPQVKRIVQESGIGAVCSPNFSIGVLLFLKIVEEAAKLINRFDLYDVSGHEEHHRLKCDSPSGTSKILCDLLIANIERKKQVVYDRINNPIDPEQLHFSSLRCGSIPGSHTVLLDSPHDTITICHQARNRQGFASGAILAAEWLAGKSGFYTMNDII